MKEKELSNRWILKMAKKCHLKVGYVKLGDEKMKKRRKMLILGVAISLFVATSMVSYSVGYKAGEDRSNYGNFEYINDTVLLKVDLGEYTTFYGNDTFVKDKLFDVKLTGVFTGGYWNETTVFKNVSFFEGQGWSYD